LLTVSNAHGIQSAPNHVIANAWEVLNTATSDQDDRVLLQIVANAGNVGSHLNAIGQTDAGYFSQRRVWFLGSLRIHASTDTPLLRGTVESRTRGFVFDLLATLANKLVNCRHCCFPFRWPPFRGPERKRALPASFRNSSGSQRRRLPCFLNWIRDVLNSLNGGCGCWLP
jgi:hypothetical protein